MSQSNTEAELPEVVKRKSNRNFCLICSSLCIPVGGYATARMLENHALASETAEKAIAEGSRETQVKALLIENALTGPVLAQSIAFVVFGAAMLALAVRYHAKAKRMSTAG